MWYIKVIFKRQGCRIFWSLLPTHHTPTNTWNAHIISRYCTSSFCCALIHIPAGWAYLISVLLVCSRAVCTYCVHMWVLAVTFSLKDTFINNIPYLEKKLLISQPSMVQYKEFFSLAFLLSERSRKEMNGVVFFY